MPTTMPAGEDSPIGKDFVRRDGRPKVTGKATYSAEWDIDGCIHAVGVTSDIARGSIASIDTSAAEQASGFKVLTHETVGKLNDATPFPAGAAATSVKPLSKEIFHDRQWVAVAFGATIEAATHAASLVKVTYDKQTPTTDFEANLDTGEAPEQVQGQKYPFEKGDAEGAFESAEVKVDEQYRTPMENHNPIEPHATTAHWHKNDAGEDALTVYDASQFIFGVRTTLAAVFDLEETNVRVVCKFIGGAFGCKGNLWPHTILAAEASRFTGKPVRFVVTREQMYGDVGHRPPSTQTVKLGASKDGKLKALIHEGSVATNFKDSYTEAFTVATRVLYGTETMRLAQKLVKRDTQSPTFMRAPGETPGMFALESAVDELADKLGMDPIELRRVNDTPNDPQTGTPFSQRKMMECFDMAADRFGWADRQKPGERMEGHWKVGMGCAAATYHASHLNNTVKLRLNDDGTVLVTCGTHEMGTGTTTAQAAVAASILGLPFERVKFELGDTNMPFGHVSGGSMTTAGVGGAIVQAANQLKRKLHVLCIESALGDFARTSLESVAFQNGQLVNTSSGKGVPLEKIIAEDNAEFIEVEGTHGAIHAPGMPGPTSNHSFGAQFAEVGVDEELGLIRIRRLAGCFACGTILNAKTARSQFIGGIVMGVGQALMEETKMDHRFGRITNANLAEYHVPTNADIGPIDISWISEPDYAASPIGAKGVGEIGITGVSAAIANAVYNACGIRLRELPLVPAKLMTT